MFRPWLLLAVAAMLVSTGPATAETKHCTVIDEVPYRIAAPGIYCLNQDLQLASTASAPKNAITIEGISNVVVDCNGHTITGPGGASSGVGVYSISGVGPAPAGTNDIVVRNCRLRGLRPGILLLGTRQLVENNDVDGAMGSGIQVLGRGSIVRHNRVMNTVGWTGTSGSVAGIRVSAGVDVLDNVIHRVTAAVGSDDEVYGIESYDTEAVIADNRIHHLVKDDQGAAYGIYLRRPERVSVHGNRMSNPEGGVAGVYCDDPEEPGFEEFPGIASDNHFNGFLGGVVGCIDDGHNVMQ